MRLAWRGLGQPHLEAGSPGWGPPSGTIPARGFWSDAMCAYVALGLPRSSAPGLLRRLAATSGLPFPPASNGQLPSSSAAQSAVWDLQPSWWCLRKQGELCQNHRLALRAAWCRPQAGGGARPAPGALGLPHSLACCPGPRTSLPTRPLSPVRSPLTGRHGAALCFWPLTLCCFVPIFLCWKRKSPEFVAFSKSDRLFAEHFASSWLGGARAQGSAGAVVGAEGHAAPREGGAAICPRPLSGRPGLCTVDALHRLGGGSRGGHGHGPILRSAQKQPSYADCGHTGE